MIDEVGPYRLVGRIKNNRLWEAIITTYPEITNQAAAARKLGISVTMMGNLLNMKVLPWSEKNGWWNVTKKLEALLGWPPEYLFDAVWYGNGQASVSKAIPSGLAKKMLGRSTDPHDPGSVFEEKEVRQLVGELIDTLPEKPKQVLLERVLNNKTLEETGNNLQLGVGIERVRQIEARACRDLRKRISSNPRFSVLKSLWEESNA
jgi:hypothetical protein